MHESLWGERRGLTHDLKLVVHWLFSREGKAYRHLFLSQIVFIAVVIVTCTFWNPVLSQIPEERADRDLHLVDYVMAYTPVYLFALAFLCAILFKAQHIRVAQMTEDEQAHHYRMAVQREYAQKYADRVTRLYDEQDEWRAKTQAELYETILDQVERGVLKPRPEYPGDSYDFPNSA